MPCIPVMLVSIYSFPVDQMEYSLIPLKELLFCRTYADAVGPENAKKYQTVVFLAGSASAEFFADIGLCPFEAVKVKLRSSLL